ncbi:DNA gyrase, B subunit [Alicyclobacillus hesperidum URH17-3-68]|uniref:hypothetical protein n=1 Tax=Alicyclobacillus hesperidum TaxID=89784 RepID=UPI000281B8AB|nr:hypothetical protein [Alicyclobacillus hesperidum]EJY55889.1 DNA gyrase, B subunit [Alicyclobacillus hesperidum URH17-3-68]
MFVIHCNHCSREVEWKDGAELGKLQIEVCGSTVICACGHGVSDDNGTLREFDVPDAE